MTDKVIEQILYIRASGVCNMFDVACVQKQANKQGFYELVLFLEEHRKEYVHYILTGEKV